MQIGKDADRKREVCRRACDVDVAVVGMACRFPDANTPEEYWSNLLQGKISVQEIPASRWQWDKFSYVSEDGLITPVSRWCAFIDGLEAFDASFFGISKIEADSMDPQQRIMLELCWKCLEDAGVPPSHLAGTATGVFVGVFNHDYKELLDSSKEQVHAHRATGTAAAIIANRISYFFDLKGPSMVLDTACSGSLFALHQAVQSIRSGEINHAFVGGVNLLLTATRHVAFSKMRMLSPSGRCYSFDERADGYVRGEGGGVLLLKSLESAVRDGNRIHGIIRSVNLNHTGKSHTLTHPNAEAQASVIRAAWSAAGLSSQEMDYIEAHGTGTFKGDPIEWQGIILAREQLASGFTQAPLCPVGSAKPNIGHLEAAAGIAGVIKVLLAFRHSMLPGLATFTNLNPSIISDQKSLYALAKLESWPIKTDAQGNPRPRFAGVSSFGFGGTNAHAVLEEYCPEKFRSEAEHPTPVTNLLVLSAKKENSLIAFATQLLQFCSSNIDLRLRDLCYTFQTGREHLNFRVAFVAADREGLLRALERFVTQGLSISDESVMSGTLSGSASLRGLPESEGNQTVNPYGLETQDLTRLAQLWIRGVEIDWRLLYKGDPPRIIDTPSYPFQRDSHWLPTITGEELTKIPEDGFAVRLTAEYTELASENLLSLPVYRSDFFLRDHRIIGREMLPAVVYLEVVHSAMWKLAGTEQNDPALRFENVVWFKGLRVDADATKVSVRLSQQPDSTTNFSVQTVDHLRSQAVEHASGQVQLVTMDEARPLDLVGLQRMCSERDISAEKCYSELRDFGFVYGPALQSIESLHFGKGRLLARLKLPEELRQEGFHAWLHPSIADGALQAALIFWSGSTCTAALPFALENLLIFRPTQSEMWAAVGHSPGSDRNGDTQRIDVALSDDLGVVCALFQGLVFRQTVDQARLSVRSSGSDYLTLLPSWKPLANPKQELNNIGDGMDCLVFVTAEQHWRELHKILPRAERDPGSDDEGIEHMASRLRNYDSRRHIVFIAPESEATAAASEELLSAQEGGVIRLFRIIKAVLLAGWESESVRWTVVTSKSQAIQRSQEFSPAHASIFGLAATLAKEYPHFKLRIVDVESTGGAIFKRALCVPFCPSGKAELRTFRDGQWWIRELVPVKLPVPAIQKLYRRSGVYVVVGGAGGIGEVWTRWMIEKFDAKVVWIGRRNLDSVVAAKQTALEALGTRPFYIQADARNLESLKAAQTLIVEHFGKVDGIVHSALVLEDKSLAWMDEGRFRASLEAKVDICVRLAQVFGVKTLDFFLFFSSIRSLVPAAGQSNYAAGCSFSDAFAQSLAQILHCEVKVMNWGYWGSIGIVMDEFYRLEMAKDGFGSIEPEEAMEALQQLADGPFSQVAFLRTSKDKHPCETSQCEVVRALQSASGSYIGDMTYPSVGSGWSGNLRGGLVTPEMDDLIMPIIGHCLRLLGVDAQARSTGLLVGTHILPKYERWVRQTLILLSPRGGEQQSTADLSALWREWDERSVRWRQDRDQCAQQELAEVCLRELSNVLTGRKEVTEVLFPQGGSHLVASIYKGNAISDLFNDVVATCVISHLEEHLRTAPSGRLRILEVGAGTGGTTSRVLEKLGRYSSHIQEYAYTDVSRFFLTHGEQTYGRGLPFFRTYLFDVTRSLAEQGIELGRYDIVIATNVIHATTDVRASIRNLKRSLGRGGLLILNELSSSSVFCHVTFGLLDGWWLFRDPEWRIPGTPAVTSESWLTLLRQEGFQNLQVPVQTECDYGQQVILAHSDGIVRLETQFGSPVEAHEHTATSFSSKDVPALEPNEMDERAPAAMNDLHYVQNVIASKLAEALDVDSQEIDQDTAFSDYGVDSVLGVGLTQKLYEALGIKLRSTILFEFNTAKRLAQHIASSGATLKRYSSDVNGSANQKQNSVPVADRSSKHLKAESAPVKISTDEVGLPAVTVKAMSETVNSTGNEPIAIIGMSGRFAGSENVDELWEHLAAGHDLVGEARRWNLQDVYANHPQYCRQGTFLEGVDEFDAGFFQISPLEATYMDPQQRLFLQEAWRTLESAGYAGSKIEGQQCGVYVGCLNGDYSQLFQGDIPAQAFWGNSASLVPARISYYLNLHGPAVSIDTACSSSLVAIHLACQSLRSGEVRTALAGGVFVQATPAFYHRANRAGMLALGGRCRTFDRSADGFVPGEGVGVLMLKKLSAALAEGDFIFGVVRASGISQDGATNGITAPSAQAQAQLETDVYQRFHVHPDTIQMVEAHGTGTVLGDPIEIEGLTRSFRNFTVRSGFCAIGSLKTNIGHAVTAAGVAGVIKVLLALRHNQIPASLHFDQANANIDFADSPFYVNTSLRAWPEPGSGVRRAAVSSFGFSGTNAHIVIEEAPRTSTVIDHKPAYLIFLSARTHEQLRQLVLDMLSYARKRSGANLQEVSFTLLTGRKHWLHRWASVIRDQAELIETMEAWLATDHAAHVWCRDCSHMRPDSGKSGESQLGQLSAGCVTAQSERYIENLRKIAEVLVQGGPVVCDQLFSPGIRRLPLPGYPFARERYWVDTQRAPDVGADLSRERISSLEDSPVKHGETFGREVSRIVSGDETFLLCRPVWRSESDEGKHVLFSSRHLILCDALERDASFLAQHLTACSIHRLDASAVAERASVGERALQSSRRVLDILQEILSRPITERVLLQLAFPESSDIATYRALAAILMTAERENPLLTTQIVETDAMGRNFLDQLQSFGYSSRHRSVRHVAGQRTIRGVEELPYVRQPLSLPWRTGGTYVLTGGAGGLGLIFAEEIASRVGPVNLVLVGRSQLSAKQQTAVIKLQTFGAHVEYLQADIGVAREVNKLITDVLQRYGHLNGVLHAAGVTRDSYLVKKTTREFRDVLSPKIDGASHLDEACKDVKLDLFILFSSIVSVLGNAGQADYAFANALLNSFAEQREALVHRRQRYGRTLSVVWPLLKDGGMSISESSQRFLRETIGLVPVTTKNAITMFYRALVDSDAPVIIAATNTPEIRHSLGMSEARGSDAESRLASVMTPKWADPERLRQMERRIGSILASQLGLNLTDVAPHRELMEYGVDSIMLTKFALELNKVYNTTISPAVFFQYQTVADLAVYLFQQIAETSLDTGGSSSSISKRFGTVDEVQSLAPGSDSGTVQTEDSLHSESIAIIGMSGQFPQAEDIAAFWTLLAEGKDCISEVPKSRWDWRTLGETNVHSSACLRYGGFLEGVDQFDPLFFGISPREAEQMDPQQRLMMQHIWLALEDAGYAGNCLSGSDAAIYMGVLSNGYGKRISQAGTSVEGYSSTGSLASIGPARMSYFLNLHGPSEPVDTACSSSLVAVHRAVQDLRQGVCKVAIAGGVNVLADPEVQVSLMKAGVLSEDGRCKAFSKDADGYGRSEGVGVLVLKRLRDAQADRDHIYGVIRETAQNHGGRSSSLTAPNPTAQADLLTAVYTKAGVDPFTVSYIEAHGTGTVLGDPVEINALTSAFATLAHKQSLADAVKGRSRAGEHRCALGSVKTNIGHLEAAAGIAGMIKVLLQFKHRSLVKSLHCHDLNPYIVLQNSPFYINTETTCWQPTVDGTDSAIALRAGVSSFGIGGVNAHVILEEYKEPVYDRQHDRGPYLIVLSAQRPEALRQAVRRLHTSLLKTPQAISSIAYTLQVGRQAMADRLAMIVENEAELMLKLEALAGGALDVEGVYRGHVKRNNELLALITGDEDLASIIDLWVEKRKFSKILELWVGGLTFDWTRLYPEPKPSRVSLPGYSFAKERLWIHTKTNFPSAAQSGLHPLVHENISDLKGQTFRSQFSGQEFFFEDHQVQGRRIFPGVAYLEIARECFSRSVPRPSDHLSNIRLEEIVWSQPLLVGQNRKEEASCTVRVSIAPRLDNSVSFSISSVQSGSEQLCVHCEGVARYESAETPRPLDISSITSECQSAFYSADQCYKRFQQIGITYGTSFQGIQELRCGDDEALARISVPERTTHEALGFVLHPSLLDSALQSAIAFRWEGSEAILPFSLDRIQIFAPCPAEAWAHVKQRPNIDTSNQLVVDLDLCDKLGDVCVRLEGLHARCSPKRECIDLKSRMPVWTKTAIPGASSKQLDLVQPILAIGGNQTQQALLKKLCPNILLLSLSGKESIEVLADELRGSLPFSHLLWIAPSSAITWLTDEALLEQQDLGLIELFRVFKALLSLDQESTPLECTIVTFSAMSVDEDEQIDPTHAGVHGFIGSLAKEFTGWKMRVVDLSADQGLPIEQILQLPVQSGEAFYAGRNGHWYQQRLVPLRDVGNGAPPYREKGVYVVVGGAGGIGEVWTRHLIEHHRARVIWLGRRPRNTEIQTKIDQLAKLGPAPVYLQADATNRYALEDAYEQIKTRFGSIHGVVNAAIVLHDQSFLTMSESTFRRSVAAKLDTSLRIAQVFQNEALDFVLFFSSMQSFVRAPGQSNYAAGCTFMDAYAAALKLHRKIPVKVVNWGYWGSVGVVSAEPYRHRMARAGIGSIEPQEGMLALEAFLRSGLSQAAISKDVVPVRKREEPRDAVVRSATSIESSAREAASELKRLRQQQQEVDDVLLRLLAIQLESLRAKEHDTGMIPKSCSGTADLYARWWRESDRLLLLSGLSFDSDLARSRSIDDSWSQWEQLRATWGHNKELAARIHLAEVCLKALPEVLKGYLPATDVLFPNSSLALVEPVYKNDCLVDYYNKRLAEALIAQVRKRNLASKHGKVRILEIGAGTGGTTATCLSQLRGLGDCVQEYTYTDVSRAFLLHAQKEYVPQAPYLITKLFDVSRPPEAQGLSPKSYDIVIAANAIHVTADIRNAIKNAKMLLRENGVLLLNELSHNSVFAHITFGLLEGWWLFQDSALRIVGCPGLTPSSWTQVLRQEGFSNPDFPASEAHELGQQVIVAEVAASSREPNLTESVRFQTEQSVMTKGNGPGLEIASLRDRAITYVKEQVASTFQIQIEQLDEAEAFATYGIDSILIVQLTRRLNDLFEDMRTTVLFEVQTIGGLADYLLRVKQDRFRYLLEVASSVSVSFETNRTAHDVKPSQTNYELPRAWGVSSEATRKMPLGQIPATTAAIVAASDESSSQELRQRAISYIRNLVASTFNIAEEELDPFEALATYGIDSILIVQLTRKLNEVFRGIQTTLLFQVQTIEGIADFLLANRRDQLAELLEPRLGGVPEATSSAGEGSGPEKIESESRLPAEEIGSADNYVLDRQDEVAVIGMSGRFPGADNVGQFWDNLKEGRDSIREIPADRWNWQEYFDEGKAKPGKTYSKWGGFLSSVDKFDSLFFGISPREAEQMNPQERLFLEETYRAIEDACYTPESLSITRRVGVFVGVMNDIYQIQPTHWSVANRVSYTLNFQGPSISLDTACSSSLTAVHLALESLRSGTSECAVVGGVNLILHPEHYIGLCRMIMLSPGDKCRSFGEGADGIVDAEAVVALVLKPLKKALADSDRIYGVIRGSMINAGGKTNGYTVPNPKAQAQLISDALHVSKVHPRTVTYIEAHGTGTNLGDPVEIAGLTDAFAGGDESFQDRQGKQYCAIGSVKSNIGHAESAAGMVGLVKVLLQLQHRTLVPSLHSKDLNPNIDFSQTPFQVQQQLAEWVRPRLVRNGIASEFPRIAGVSAFGAGGANAHVIVQEAPVTHTAVPMPPWGEFCVVLLSSKQDAQLRQMASDLHRALVQDKDALGSLHQIAFTLQVGRQSLKHRLAVVVRSRGELQSKLQDYLHGERNIESVYEGSGSGSSPSGSRKDVQHTAEQSSTHGRLIELAELWTRGAVIDWCPMYGNSTPLPTSLPSYPFAAVRHWRQARASFIEEVCQRPGATHPLLEEATSADVVRQYKFTYDGTEFFLSDHLVRSEKVLPAAVYAEMALAAIQFNAPAGYTRLELKDFAWLRVVSVRKEGNCLRLNVSKTVGNTFVLEFAELTGDHNQVTCSGRGEVDFALVDPPAKVDLTSLRSECALPLLSRANCYERFAACGIEYGPSFQVISSINVGHAKAVTQLELPEHLHASLGSYVLHPALLDAAFQSTIAFAKAEDSTHVPIGFDSLEVLRPCPKRCWVVGHDVTTKNEPKFDLDLCNDDGEICVRIRSLRTRPWPTTDRRKATSEVLWRSRVWTAALPVTTDERKSEGAKHERMVFMCGLETRLAQKLEDGLRHVRCRTVSLKTGGLDERYISCATDVYLALKEVLLSRPRRDSMVQVIIPWSGQEQLLGGLHPLLKTAELEDRSLKTQLVGINPNDSSSEILKKLEDAYHGPRGELLRYDSSQPLASRWKENESLLSAPSTFPWKVGGVYLVTGGAGGLGRIFAKEIARTAKHATIVLTGRSPVTEALESDLYELRTLGPDIHYVQSDISDRGAVRTLMGSIQGKVGQVNGIIHSAGTIQDCLLVHKSKQDFRSVLTSKVSGAWHLDEATRDSHLDLFVMFSSLAGVVGSIGQSDYAAANGFLSQFALYRDGLVQQGQRYGRTLSLAWPMWESGGMQMPLDRQSELKEKTGLVPMPTEVGLKVFYDVFYSTKCDVAVMYGDAAHIRSAFQALSPDGVKEEGLVTLQACASDSLRENVVDYLKTVVASALSTDRADLDASKSLQQYGLESFVAIEMTRTLSDDFPNLSHTLLFEYATINELADFFLSSHQDIVNGKFRSLSRASNLEKSLSNPVSDGRRVADRSEIWQVPKKAKSTQTPPEDRSGFTRAEEVLSEVRSPQQARLESAPQMNSVGIDDLVDLFGAAAVTHINGGQTTLKSGELFHEGERSRNDRLARLTAELEATLPVISYESSLYPYIYLDAQSGIMVRASIDYTAKLLIPFLPISEESYHRLASYAEKNGLTLLMVDRYHKWADTERNKLVPLGVWQDLDIATFSLLGRKVRKMRYMVERFSSLGDVRTEEYKPSHSGPLPGLKTLMTEWGRAKGSVLRHSLICMEELLDGKLRRGYRAFVTFQAEQLCSVIVIGYAGSSTYVMDQEYYDPSSAPMGHMEYAIHQMIKLLHQEGMQTLSLGLTWYPFLNQSDSHRNDTGWRWLCEQNEKGTLLSKIFQEAKTNYQFKKKFGVEGESVYAYVPVDAPFRTILSYWPHFAKNTLDANQLAHALNRTSDVETSSDTSTASQQGNSVDARSLECVHGNDIPHDLMTDSWFGRDWSVVRERRIALNAMVGPQDENALRALFPFRHLIAFQQGRVAEEIFYHAFRGSKKRIVSSISWSSTLFHQLNHGFRVTEIPVQDVFSSNHLPFKGELDLDALDDELRRDPESIGMVGLELLNNASGGHPVRLSHIAAVKSRLRTRQIPLVLDGSRILRNAVLIQQYEEPRRDEDVWSLVRQCSQLADHLILSLTKDFGVPEGGLIATNDDRLFASIQHSQQELGISADLHVMNFISRSLQNKTKILEMVHAQLAFTQRLGQMLQGMWVPVLQPAIGHSVVIDVSRLSEGQTSQERKQRFLTRLFTDTGIRGSMHQAGKQKNTTLAECIRLAVPLGMCAEEEAEISEKLRQFFEGKGDTSTCRPIESDSLLRTLLVSEEL
jgi:polyketide synthase PksM